MKNIYTLLFFLLSASGLFAQDIILKKNGDEIQAKVEEISTAEIRYKKQSNLSGPSYTISATEVYMIKYANGTNELISNKAKNEIQYSNSTTATKTQDTKTPGPATPKANKKIKYGFKAGLAMSNVNSEDFKAGGFFEDWEVYPRFGFSGGFLIDFTLFKNLSLQPEFLLTMKGCKREGYTDIINAYDPDITLYHDAFLVWKVNFTYIEIPINIIYKIPVKAGSIYVGTGPYLAYGISGKSKITHSYNGINIDDEMIESAKKSNLFTGENKMYKPFDFGLNFLAGYEFKNGFFLNAGYSFSLISIGDYSKTKNNYFNAGLGVKF